MPNRPNFPIPENIHPEMQCIQLCIPNEPTYKSVFAGLIYELTYWYNWQRTDDDSGAQCAAVWKEIYNSIDWSTMSCCDCPENIYNSTNFILNQQIALQLQSMDTGTVASYAPNAPDTTFSTDSRDSTPEQQASTIATLCLACDNYVRYTLGENMNAAAQTATETTAIGVAVGLVNPIAGALVTLIGLLPYAEMLEIANDHDSIQKVICAMYDGLKDKAVTFANFRGALSSYSPPAGHAAELANMIALTLNDERNFRAFMVYLQLKQDGATNSCDSCDEGCPDWNFLTSNQGFTYYNFGYGNEGTYVLGSGWQDSYDPHGGANNNLLGIRSPDVIGCSATGGVKVYLNVYGIYPPVNGIDGAELHWEVSGQGFSTPSALSTPTTGEYILDFAGILPDATLDNCWLTMHAQAADWYVTRIEIY